MYLIKKFLLHLLFASQNSSTAVDVNSSIDSACQLRHRVSLSVHFLMF